MKDYILEVCADSVESVLAAQKGGASRIELCSNLIIGGTTPSTSLYKEIRKYSDIPVHALIRPRFGDFCYTDAEFSIIRDEIRAFKKLGVDGVVIGMLNPDGTLDTKRMRILMEEAEGLSVTLHRAFDVCRDPHEALEQAIDLGFTSILTSGQENSCIKGTDLLADLKKQADGRIHILAGAGIGADVIEPIYQKTGIKHYHMSGKKRMDSKMQYRKEGVNMGLPSFSEFELYRTDEEAVRSARNVLESL